MKVTMYTVNGMSCQHCVHHVTMALQEVAGVRDVKVDLLNKTALVSAEDTVSFATLQAAVAAAGYELAEKK